MPSVFISHSNKDREAVDRFKAVLRDRGYSSLFIDYDPEHGIPAGSVWERELYRNLKLSGAVIVLCSPDSMRSRWCFAEIAQAKALGKAVFPVVIACCHVDNVLTDRQVIDLTVAGEKEAYQRLFDGLRAAGLDPGDNFDWDPTRPPFPGFLCFDEQDAGIFFGREAEARHAIETLTRLERQGEPRLLFLVGPSGSGKSSVVRAGVVPRLAKDRSRWVVVAPFRPKGDPIGELARAVSSAFPAGPDRPDWKTVRDRLRDEGRAAAPRERAMPAPQMSALSDYADDLTMALGRREASVLIVADQAEELIQTASVDDSSAFLSVLRQATERPGGRIFGLLTLRSDFLGSLQDHTVMRGVPFADLPLGHLPVENFPQVIEGPAASAQIALEPGLVATMVADARADDALPLLAFTLREMYERCRRESCFTLNTYRDELGGINGAVARVVERIRSEQVWTPDAGRALRRAFLKLVKVNDEGRFTRQPCRWVDLPEPAAPLLEAFVKARLLSSYVDTVEVTHESLFRAWPELAGWLDESRELLLWKKGIHDEVKDWTAHDRSPDRLLSGARVAEARRWLGSNADDFSDADAEFLRASIAADDDRVAREHAQQEELRAQIRVATSRQLAALSVAEREKRFDRSLLLAVEAFRADKTFEARDSLYQSVQCRPGLTAFLHVNRGGVECLAFSPDAKLAAAGCLVRSAAGSVVELWDVVSRKSLANMPLAVEQAKVSSLEFSPDGKTIAAGYAVSSDEDFLGGVVLWDVHARKRLVDEPLSVTEGPVTSVAFSPNGKIIAAGFHGNRSGVVLWDLDLRKRLVDAPLPSKEGAVQSVAFSPDGKIIAAGYAVSSDEDFLGGVVLWDVHASKRLVDEPLSVTEGPVTSVAFSPDGKTFAAGYSVRRPGESACGGVVLWDVAARTRVVDKPLATEGSSVWHVAFNPDGKSFAAGCGVNGGVVGLWDVAACKRLVDESFPLKGAQIRSVAFSPNGTTFAAGYDDRSDGGGVVLWDAAARGRLDEEPIFVEEGDVMSVAFSPDGKTVAAGYGVRGGGEGGVVLLDVAARKRLVDPPLCAKEGQVLSVAFSREGDIIVTGHGGNGVELWDVVTRKRLVNIPLSDEAGVVKSVAFSPDGKKIAAGYNRSDARGGVVLLEVAARKRLVNKPLAVNLSDVSSIAFSPDGKTVAAGTGVHALYFSFGGVVLLDAAARTRLIDEPLSVKEGDVESLAFSPDGKIIAAGYYVEGGNEGGVVLWDMAAIKRLIDKPIAVKEGVVRSVAFSPDGRTIAAGYRDRGRGAGGVVLVDVAAHTRLADPPLSVKEGDVRSVAFSPDGKTVAAGFHGSGGGGVVLFDVDVESWQRRAGQIANRNLTREEWRNYFPEAPYHVTFPDLPVPPEENAN